MPLMSFRLRLPVARNPFARIDARATRVGGPTQRPFACCSVSRAKAAMPQSHKPEGMHLTQTSQGVRNSTPQSIPNGRDALPPAAQVRYAQPPAPAMHEGARGTTAQCSAVQCRTVQHSTVQGSTGQ
eukprot:CAMPEP_0119371366 /NCGR_PEP_ID=MMETSP1334-20130426/17548_1 /TAXON_ID=127549 /ORGANISM="Calcidiscus leptoporus, Strain RCC1130" /LENGTH=126 /DNA_ID=CAMNT_0007388621 /DNA_START=300 /DNA_END=680 /DNA_ORIENTATION=+